MTDRAEETRQEINKRADWSAEDWQDERNRIMLAFHERLSNYYKPMTDFSVYRNTTVAQAVRAYVRLKKFFLEHFLSYDLGADRDDNGIKMFQDDDEDQTFYFQIKDAVHDEPLSSCNLIYALEDGSCEGLIKKDEVAVQLIDFGYPLNGFVQGMAEMDVEVKFFYHEDTEAYDAKEAVKRWLGEVIEDED